MPFDPKKTLSLIREASPFEFLFVGLMVMPPLLIAWLTVTEKLKFSDESAAWITGVVLAAYIIAGVLFLIGSLKTRSRKVACLQIINYLDSHRFRMMSFDRVRLNINKGYTDPFLISVLEAYPELLRPARLKGSKHGAAKVQQVVAQEAEEEEGE